MVSVKRKKKNNFSLKKEGQALVEFVIILPIFLMLFLGVIDFGKIFYNKIILESTINDVISLNENNMSEEEIKEKLDLKDMNLIINEDTSYKEISLAKEIEIITPGLNLILNNPYKLEVKRSIIND